MRELRVCSLTGGRWPARKLGTSDPTPTKQGNQPEGPCGGKRAPEHGNVRGKYGGGIELPKRINETRADSKTGARDAAGGIDDARPPHRYRLAARGVSAHAQGRSHGRRRANGRRVREQAGRKSLLAARRILASWSGGTAQNRQKHPRSEKRGSHADGS